ncbi:MAG: glycoside hydrolase family 3 protein [Treponema sp.]|nr:glycoside hydrolase family 3 protein [Treponema sp.]MCL2250811.1 glycoside hydrolase family 3 protein [Treponema sp.]
MKRLLYFLLLINSFSLFAQAQLSFNDPRPPLELASAIVNAMTDEQALAQVFMLGWVGEEPSPLIMEWIRRRNIGGVKIFGWNTTDTLRLARTVGELQSLSLEGAFKIPLLVATDQEGGWIRHIRGATSETPGNMAIGASGYPRDAYLSGYYIGKELALLGVNMNFAPAVDLFTNRDSVLIGPRAFGSDPVRAGILGMAFARGQLSAGVIPTAKHYPGHGATELDSHGILPRIEINFDTLWNRELLPYRMLVSEGIPVIMSGHISFPQTEGGLAPASLSSWFLRDVLRGRIGFKGLVITDDLNMVGATSFTGALSRTAKQALIAGNDILLFSNTPVLTDMIWTLLINSMRTEEDFNQIVRASARRVLELKLKYLRGENAVPYIPDLAKAEAELSDPDGSAFFLNLAARSVTIVKSQASGFPLTKEKAGRVLLTGRFTDFYKYGRLAFPNNYSFVFSSQTTPANLIAAAGEADTIIFCLADNNDLRMLNNLRQLNKPVYVISVLSPVHIENVNWVTGAIAVYSYAPESFASAFSAITGRIPALGILPYE